MSSASLFLVRLCNFVSMLIISCLLPLLTQLAVHIHLLQDPDNSLKREHPPTIRWSKLCEEGSNVEGIMMIWAKLNIRVGPANIASKPSCFLRTFLSDILMSCRMLPSARRQQGA